MGEEHLDPSLVRGVELEDTLLVDVTKKIPGSCQDGGGLSSSRRSVKQKIGKVGSSQ